jgi:hypothetical protein
MRTIHQSLRLALCAHGLFFSKHPYLATLLGNPLDKANVEELATQYLEQAEKLIPKIPQMEMEIIDCIRSLLVIMAGYFALGKFQEGGKARGTHSS